MALEKFINGEAHSSVRAKLNLAIYKVNTLEGSGKFKGIYVDGAKEADTYWISANRIWRTLTAFTSAAPPAAGVNWELVMDIPEAKFPVGTITTDAIAKLAAGTDISGKTPTEVIIAAAISYQAPSFTAFTITGENNLTVPLGYKILKEVALNSGRVFNWSTANSANVAANSVAIRNQTAATILAQGLANDGTEAIVLPADIQLLANGSTQTFRVEATNTNGALFTRDLTFTSRPLTFIGVAAPPATIDEAFIRSLTTRTLASGHPSTVSGNMGAGEKLYYAYPKAFGNRYFKTSLGTLSGSLVQDGGVTVRTDEQITFTLAGIEYSVTASEQAGLGNTTYELATS